MSKAAYFAIPFLASLPLLAQPTTAPSPRTADAIVAELEALPSVKPDRERVGDAAYRAEFQKQLAESQQKQSALALELFKAAPDDARTMKYMNLRWHTLGAKQGDVVLPEIESALASGKLSAADKKNALRTKAMILIAGGREEALPAIDALLAEDKADPAAGQLLYVYAQQLSHKTPEKAEPILQRLAKDYPDDRYGQMAKSQLETQSAVGKPFELSFTDAITDKPITMNDLKGKVVVIDFWATWCGPCVAEMPANKKLYAEFKDKGVEFIGISLDKSEAEGGLTALKKFVKENEIGWPQYFQGKFWEGDFSKKWGVNSIPRVFIIDADGKLASTEARGNLETLIPELITKRDGKK